jgi:hypothetical protein
MSNKNSYNFLNYFLPIFMIIAPYKFLTLFLNYGIVIFIFYLLYLFFFRTNIEMVVYKPLFYFTSFSMLFYFFNNWRLGIFNMSTINNIIFAFLSILIISIVTNKLNFSKFYNFYKLIGYICCIVVIGQFFLLYFFNIEPLPITILPVSVENLYIWQSSNEATRPSAFFSEPQAFASFLLPLLILSLYKKNFGFVFLIILSILFTGSTLGIISIFFIGVFYFIDNYDIGNIKYITSFSIISITLITLFFSLGVMEDYAQKLLSTDLMNNPRLLRSFNVLLNFSMFDLTFGIGDNLKNFILQNINDQFVRLYIENNLIDRLSYITTIAGNFVKYGVFIGLAYLVVLKNIFTLFSSTAHLKALAFTIIFLSFGQTILFNSWFIFYFSIIFGLIDDTKSKLFSKWIIN